MEHPKIEILWNSVVEEAYGNEKGTLGGVKLKNVKTGGRAGGWVGGRAGGWVGSRGGEARQGEGSVLVGATPGWVGGKRGEGWPAAHCLHSRPATSAVRLLETLCCCAAA